MHFFCKEEILGSSSTGHAPACGGIYRFSDVYVHTSGLAARLFGQLPIGRSGSSKLGRANAASLPPFVAARDASSSGERGDFADRPTACARLGSLMSSHSVSNEWGISCVRARGVTRRPARSASSSSSSHAGRHPPSGRVSAPPSTSVPDAVERKSGFGNVL
jgi:hypothetical protein